MEQSIMANLIYTQRHRVCIIEDEHSSANDGLTNVVCHSPMDPWCWIGIRNKRMKGISHVLANQENINGTEVEFIEEWQGRKAFFRGMHSGVKLYEKPVSSRTGDCIWESEHTMTVLPLY